MASHAAFLSDLREGGLDNGSFYIATDQDKHIGKILEIWPDATVLAREFTTDGVTRQHISYIPYTAIREIHALRDKPAAT